MTSGSRIGAMLLLVGAAFALIALGPASAHTHAPGKYGGTLVVGLSRGDPGNLDPLVGAGSPSAIEINVSLCQRLYDRDARQQLVPLLAASAPAISKDKLTYTIRLRQGVEFNDGTPFNAQAVASSVQRFMNYPASPRAADFASIDSVSASGPYTVVYHLNRRDSSFIGGNPYVFSPTQLAKLGANFGTNPVCVGPFMFDHQAAGDNVTLIKSPYYYDQKDVYLDKIVYKPMPDAAAAVAALKAGDIDALDQVAATALPDVRQTSSLRVIQAYQVGWKGFFINIGNKHGVLNLPYANVGTPLASSPKLRQAFEEAIDRNTMNRVLFSGLVQPSCTPIAPSNTPWYDATKVPCTPYDPKDAKRLVALSGFSNPTVHLLTGIIDDDRIVAQFIQAQEAAVGINVVIEASDSIAALAKAVNGDFDVRLSGFVPGSPDPNADIYPFLTTSGSRNYSGYSNPRLDLILSNGLKATSVPARSTLYRTAQQIIHDDRPIICLYNPVTLAAFSTNLAGVGLTSLGTMTVANAHFK
jgi:peptide/nickel transport system substrate-binding protein